MAKDKKPKKARKGDEADAPKVKKTKAKKHDGDGGARAHPLEALSKLADHPLVNVYLVGGQFSKSSQVCTGMQVISTLSEIRFDLCFLGTNCISVDGGVTDSDIEIVQVKKALIKSSKKLVVMCISEKLDSAQRMRVCELQEIDVLITEIDPDTATLAGYRKENITVL